MALIQRKSGVARAAARREDFEVAPSDAWTRIADDAPLSEGPSLVSWARVQRDRDALQARADSIGVVIPNDLSEDDLAGLLSFALIAIEFPKFRDGRGFTFARWLRTRWGYQGELRAVGNVLRDQLLFMHRTGFDSFELTAGRDAHNALEAFGEQSVFYQASTDLPAPLWKRVSR
jgi:uncharacterized protein (DUF934 family)